MQLVVDANAVFAAIIGRDKTLKLMYSDRIELLAPQYLFDELEKNVPRISLLSGLSNDDVKLLLAAIMSRARVVYPDEVKLFKEEASKLAPHEKDAAYFAVALAFRAAIWSRERAFKRQGTVIVYTTPELVDMFNIR